MEDWTRLYNSHKREEAEPVTINVRRFKMDNKPTCMAWYGLGGFDRMACQFILVSQFGSKYSCGLTGDPLSDEMRPTDNCPLWKK